MTIKRYELYYTSDKVDRKSNIGVHLHDGGRASSIKTIKGYMRRIKKEFAADNPRDFFYTDQEYDRPLDVQNRIYLDPDRIHF